MRRARTVKTPSQRRTDLLNAAVDLFDQDGFDRTTVHDIAHAAGVAPGTLYLYFPSKEHVLHAVHVAYHGQLRTRVAAVVEEQFASLERGAARPADAVAAVVAAMVAGITADPAATGVVRRYPARVDSPHDEDADLLTFLAAALQRAAAADWLRVPDAMIAAHVVKACVYEPITRQVVYGDPPDLAALVAQVTHVLVAALTAPAPAPAAAG